MDRQGLLSLANTLGVLTNEHANADEGILRQLIERQSLP
jgi:hypothetical protein